MVPPTSSLQPMPWYGDRMTVPTPIERVAASPPLEGMDAAIAAHHSRHFNVIVEEFWQQDWEHGAA
jgi:hypothetical protein